ncbi:hypothetical protein C8D89_101841 [Actinomycetospora cinnamomea]|uniref:Uncharacterized protein n=1 Tax=Actinomycetospora cinnamomea TaxID=663609 RepID=A0A2U1FS86_9PSEU|nr:hypothetical protein C8D89_101841 [Actinomycetospora cinnamomea]
MSLDGVMLARNRNHRALQPSYRVRGTSTPAAGERVGVEHGPGHRLGVGVPDLPSLRRVAPQADFADEPDELVELAVEDVADEAPESLVDPEPLVAPASGEAFVSEEPADDSAGAFSEEEPLPARASLR